MDICLLTYDRIFTVKAKDFIGPISLRLGISQGKVIEFLSKNCWKPFWLGRYKLVFHSGAVFGGKYPYSLIKSENSSHMDLWVMPAPVAILDLKAVLETEDIQHKTT